MSPPFRRWRFVLLAVLAVLATTLVPVTASAVPHPDHTQKPRGNGPADPGEGAGRGNPNGNNGTIKIDGAPFDGHPNNEPHISCPFEVDLYGFDSAENGDTARLVFRLWPPTGSKQEIAATGFAVDQPGIDLPPVTIDGNHIIVPIDHDGAGGGVDIDREVRTFLDLPDEGAHHKHGFHVKLDAEITSAGRAYKKTKVFWVTPCKEPKIDIEKFVNGQDADTPPGPTLDPGSTATFTYVVTNNGELPLDGVAVNDNVVGPISCPRSSLGVGESMNCDSTQMEAEPGQQFMEACVEGFYVGRRVDDCDPVYYKVPPPPDPKIDIEKFVNGHDADTPPGPTLPAGSTATFTYVVTNTGDVPLSGVVVTDNVVGPISCPRTELGIGDSMNCGPTTMTAEVGLQFMEACVKGVNAGREVSDCDPVYYKVPPPPKDPKIDIEKYVNGQDADTPPGPTLEDGSTAEFTYIVLNTGDVPLENISVVDNVKGAISCPRTELGVGQRMTCTPTTMVVEVGDGFMEACVKGFNAGREVNDCDPVHYRVPPPKPPFECVVKLTGDGPKVTWTDAGAPSYEVWRNSVSIGSTGELMLTDANAPKGKALHYRVVAKLPDWKVLVADCGKVVVPDCSVHLKFYNATDGRIDVRWIGPEGAETTLGQPGAGETFHWDEFQSQAWKVYDEHGQLLLKYTPPKCGENFILVVAKH